MEVTKMKYLIRYRPIGRSSPVILNEVATIDEAEEVITQHMKQFYFPHEEARTECRSRYEVHKILKDWREVQKDQHWAVKEAVIEVDGTPLTIFTGPYRKEAQ
jgi:hypothetical protein